MASYTKFYALVAGAVLPALSAAWHGSWNINASDNGPYLMDGVKFGGVNSLKTRAETSTTNPIDVAITRFVGRKLNPQTISGTLDMVMAARETSASADFYTRVYAYVYNATDDSVLGVLLDYAESSAGDTEWTTTITGKGFTSPQSLSSQVVPNDGKDYYPVIELGVRGYNASASSFTAQTRVGAMSSALASLSDLTVGSTNTSNEAGYFVFSNAISVEDADNGAAFVAGTILIPGADVGNQGAVEAPTILSLATGDVVNYWPELPTAETGDNLPSGIFAIMAQAQVASSVVAVQVYAADKSLIASIPTSTLAAGTWGAFSPLRGDHNSTFYALRISSTTPTTLHAISDTGSVVGSWTMPTSAGRGTSALVPSRDGSKVYFGFRAGDEASSGVGRFDLAGAGSELTELIPTSAGLTIGRDLLTTAAGDILVVVFTGGSNSEIRRYDDGGTLLATYPLPSGSFVGDTILMFHNPADPASFYVRAYASTTTTQLLKIKISDGTTTAGSVLTSDDANATMIPKSCPVLVFPSAVAGPSPFLDDSEPCCDEFETLAGVGDICAPGGAIGTGSTGPMELPQKGSFGYTLNATSGGPGGGSGSAWLSITPITAESWGS